MNVYLHQSTICRLCAENNPNGVLLFDNSEPDSDLSSLINQYLPFRVYNDGKLPQTICPGCNIQLQATVQFFDLLVEGQKKIRELWRNEVMQLKRAEKEQQLASITAAVMDQVTVDQSGVELHRNELSLSIKPDTDPSEDLNSIIEEVDKQLNIQVFGDAMAAVLSWPARQSRSVKYLADFMVLGSRERSPVRSFRCGHSHWTKGPSADGLYSPNHSLVLRTEGLDKPRKKRGRPRKTLNQEIEKPVTPPPPAPLPLLVDNDSCKDDDGDIGKDDDVDGRKRRKRKVPDRYKEAVQGKELERIFREEGVIDEDEEKEVEEVKYVDVHSKEVETEVIGHLESQEGQDLGELVVVNRPRSRLKANKYSRRKKIRFQCEICGRGFMHHGRYLYHKSFHKGVKFECTACNKRFSTKDNFELHQKVSGHSGEGIVEGADEEETTVTGTTASTTSPIQLESEDISKISCDLCSKTFISKVSYEMHLKNVHEGLKPFCCDICGKGFGYHNSLKSHILTHHEPKRKEKGFPCNICGKKLNHPSSVIYHKESEHNNGCRFVCNKCGKSFKHKQLLQRHQLVHSDSRPHNCNLCPASFKTKANLFNHQATHTGEKKHFCEHCGQQFAHKTSLTLHYRWHLGEKPYQCSVCKKMFSQKGNLQEHYRIHTGEKPFACEFCARRFTTSSQFKLHMKRHTGERPWKCEFCSKSFLHKDTWKCHMRRHKGENPFQCPYCSRDFPEQWALKKHIRLHTGERPYACSLCGKTFADCSNLTKHKKVHVKETKTTTDDGGVVEGVDLSVWNIIKSHLQESLGTDRENVSKEDEEVQQIIYVAYQDPEDPENKVANVNEKYLLPNLMNTDAAQAPADALSLAAEDLANPAAAPQSLQVTDEEGNPIHFTMQDGSALQITTDGQNLQVTTKDGQTIPVQLTTQDGQPISTEMASTEEAPLSMPVTAVDNVAKNEALQEASAGVMEPSTAVGNGSIHTLEFMTQEGHTVRMVAPFEVVPLHLAPDYLNIT